MVPDAPADRDGGPSADDGPDAHGSGATVEGAAGSPADGGSLEGDESHAVDATAGERSDGRDVEVPMRVYKTVTVFSTLFAVGFVLAGFLLLDAATDRATAALSEVDPVLAVLGLLSIAAGAAVYAFGTRFRAEGMGKPKDRSDEASNNE